MEWAFYKTNGNSWGCCQHTYSYVRNVSIKKKHSKVKRLLEVTYVIGLDLPAIPSVHLDVELSWGQGWLPRCSHTTHTVPFQPLRFWADATENRYVLEAMIALSSPFDLGLSPKHDKDLQIAPSSICLSALFNKISVSYFNFASFGISIRMADVAEKMNLRCLNIQFPVHLKV